MKFSIEGRAVCCDTGGKISDPTLPTMVFIHGALHDHTIWSPQPRYFADHGFNVLAPDLPGHGDSAPPALSSIEALADWLIGLLGEAGIKQAILVGHSMGALIALETAHRAPALVRQIALLGVAYPMRVSSALLTAALEDEQSAIEMINRWSHSPPDKRPDLHAPGANILESARRLMRRVASAYPGRLLHTDLSACNNYANGEIAARGVRCPAMFIIGSADIMTPARASTSLTGAMAHARVVTLDAPHALMEEQPDAVRQALLAFVNSP